MPEPRVIYGPSNPTEENHHWSRVERPGDSRWVRTNRAYIARHPEAVIRWLQPNCRTCSYRVPEWCEDEGAWDGGCALPGCNVRPTPYRRDEG